MEEKNLDDWFEQEQKTPKVEKSKPVKKEKETPKNPEFFVLNNEEFRVRDRVRLSENINGVKASNLCEITKIELSKSGEIKVDLLSVMNHSKLLSVSISSLVND